LSVIAAALALLLSSASAALALLAQGGRFSVRLDVLTHFAPAYLALALVALPFAVLAMRPAREVSLVLAILALVASCALILPEYLADSGPRPSGGGSARPLKIVQFNAWGRNPQGEAAAAWILAQEPDIIVLEEGGALRGALLKAGYHRTCQGCGAAVFSRMEPTSEGQGKEDPRGFLSAATLQDDAGPFTVIAVHRHWPTRLAQDAIQTAEFRAIVGRYPRDRLIVAGDFNSTPWSFARRREDRELGLIRRTRHLFTWPAERISHNRLPAPFPYLPIDHVYAGPGWATLSVERGPRLGSDHYPVVVTLAPVSLAAR
jgi:endonuclease/exonuclease/phosphatase (EEP) superfamily protein YafD